MFDRNTAPCWLNGEFLPAGQASIPLFDHGLLYGDGVFEGVRFYNKRCFKLREHMERLLDSARALALTLPYDLEALVEACETLVGRFPEPSGYLRIVATRGTGGLGIDPANCSQPNVFILVAPLKMMPEEVRQQGARVIIASTRRLPVDGLDPRIKSLNYLNHILARLEANHAGVDEALMLNQSGRVAEGSTENLFIVKRGELLTPPTIDGALAGITRAAVITLAEQLGIPCREQSLAPYDLYCADELFLTGTGAELIPVREVDGRALGYCPGPIFQRLSDAYLAWVHQPH